MFCGYPTARGSGAGCFQDIERCSLVEKEIFIIKVNGKRHEVLADPAEPLLWVLRDSLRLTGTKFGCGEGTCGSCAVLIDDKARRSCQIRISKVAQGQKIVTVEGLAKKGKLSRVQQAFIEHTAFNCGFCTPGMIITAEALLKQNPAPSRDEIIRAMDDNLCRCGTYLSIIEAIEDAAGMKTSQGGE